jgi:hypothetical protein
MNEGIKGLQVQDQESSRWTVSLRRLVGNADSRRDEPIWVKPVASKAAAERNVKQWIDDRPPKPPRPKGRR